ncbi:hypothetical protein [Chryseobacterium sp.]|uniref:hypothetical protein n=2 Tax=Chryseobacterium sp. TaxID=1871047 RepID=UPI002FC856A5
MKKTLLLPLMAMSLMTSNCSGNDDNDAVPQQVNPISNSYFHPPSWIKGTWKVASTSYFQFTDDDFIYVMNGTSYKAVLTQTATAGQTAKVNEEISETDYNFTIIAGGSTGTYKFKKINTTRIQWVNHVSQQPFYLDK